MTSAAPCINSQSASADTLSFGQVSVSQPSEPARPRCEHHLGMGEEFDIGLRNPR